MFGALKRGRFRSFASLILVVNVVGELQQKRTLAASRGFLAAARLSCSIEDLHTPIVVDRAIKFSIVTYHDQATILGVDRPTEADGVPQNPNFEIPLPIPRKNR